MSVFKKYFSKYCGTIGGFNEFHNQVINMPRDSFQNINIDKIRKLASYLLLVENNLGNKAVDYKALMNKIKTSLATGQLPAHRDEGLEERYFKYDDINEHYELEGRMFRHLMGFCLFWGLVKKSSTQSRTIDYAKCKEFNLANDELLTPIVRNNIILLNINSNDFITSLKGININRAVADYRPAYGILSYIKRIGRPVTKFELSILLGRVDELQTETDIINRAVEVGKVLPHDKTGQQELFFKGMGWINANERLFKYSSSQDPDFKFNTFILFLESLGLINKNQLDSTYTLTEYAENILSDDISYLIADLEALIKHIEEDAGSVNRELTNLIVSQRNPELLELAKKDKNFIQKMNKRSIAKPTLDRNGKRVRNRLIAELAKILADYKCQFSDRHTFQMPDGKYYCEAHHIILFGDEEGPDITNNLIVLGPEAHKMIHHANARTIKEAYLSLRKNKAITLEQFEEMITEYNCITEAQIDILLRKNIITEREHERLRDLLYA